MKNRIYAAPAVKRLKMNDGKLRWNEPMKKQAYLILETIEKCKQRQDTSANKYYRDGFTDRLS